MKGGFLGILLLLFIYKITINVEMKSLSQHLKKHIKDSNKYKGFIIIKPGFENHTEEIINMIRGLKVNVKDICRKKLTYEEAKNLYIIHKDEDFYEGLCKYMSGGYSTALLLTSGSETLIEDIKGIKDIFRNKYGVSDMENVMHSSDSLDHAKKEIKVYF